MHCYELYTHLTPAVIMSTKYTYVNILALNNRKIGRELNALIERSHAPMSLSALAFAESAKIAIHLRALRYESRATLCFAISPKPRSQSLVLCGKASPPPPA